MCSHCRTGTTSSDSCGAGGGPAGQHACLVPHPCPASAKESVSKALGPQAPGAAGTLLPLPAAAGGATCPGSSREPGNSPSVDVPAVGFSWLSLAEATDVPHADAFFHLYGGSAGTGISPECGRCWCRPCHPTARQPKADTALPQQSLSYQAFTP